MYNYKMKAYKTEDSTLFNTQHSNSLTYFDRFKGKSNYRIKIFQNENGKWKLIYTELH